MARLVKKPRRKGAISVGHPGISTGVASTSIKNTRLTKIGVIIRRSTGSATDLKRKLLKVGQQVEARLLGQEELETEDQDLVTTLGRTPTLPVQLTLGPQTEPNRPE